MPPVEVLQGWCAATAQGDQPWRLFGAARLWAGSVAAATAAFTHVFVPKFLDAIGRLEVRFVGKGLAEDWSQEWNQREAQNGARQRRSEYAFHGKPHVIYRDEVKLSSAN
jgi:hypothetical protein